MNSRRIFQSDEHSNFNTTDTNVTSVTFGEILSSQGERIVQLALKFYFDKRLDCGLACPVVSTGQIILPSGACVCPAQDGEPRGRSSLINELTGAARTGGAALQSPPPRI